LALISPAAAATRSVYFACKLITTEFVLFFVSGFHSGIYECCHVVGYSAVQSVSKLTFRCSYHFRVERRKSVEQDAIVLATYSTLVSSYADFLP
jgi:hypothetical protein